MRVGMAIVAVTLWIPLPSAEADAAGPPLKTI